MEPLLEKATALAGRPVEVVKTKTNEYMVEWFDFNGPPPRGKTETEALEKFIAYKENSDAFTSASEQDSSEKAVGTLPA